MEGDRLQKLVAKVAKEELREDENTRKQSLEQLRDWIHKNPDIKGCRTDDSFLLRFLRNKKFSVLMAQQLLTNFISFRQNYREIMYNLDILNDPEVDDVLSKGVLIVSPLKDDHGRPVIFFNPRNFDYKKYDWKTMSKAVHLTLHCLMEDEDTQVLGVTYVLDMKESTPFYTLYPIRDLYTINLNTEKSYPIRHKEILTFNLSSSGLWFFNLLLSFQSEKIQERFKVYESIEDMKKNLNPRVMPKEYGGTIPMAEMIALWKKKLVAQRDNILLLKRYLWRGTV